MSIKDIEKRRQYYKDYYQKKHEELKAYQRVKQKEYYWKRKEKKE